MSSVNQDVRFAITGDPLNNPKAIYEDYKPIRFLFANRIPVDTEGENQWAFIDTDNGNFYIKKNGTWVYEYTFNTGGGGPGTIDGATNVGGFAEWFRSIVGTDLTFRTIQSSDGSVSIVQNADDIDLKVPAVSGFITDATNEGLGFQVYKQQVGSTLQFRTLTNSTGDIGLALNGDEIDITLLATPAIETVANVGGFAGVSAGILGQQLQLRSLQGSTGKVVITENATDIDFGVSLDSSDVGLNFVNNVSIGYDTISPPITADVNAGFVVGSLWSQVGASSILYICQDNTAGAAVWLKVFDSATITPTIYPKDVASQYVPGGWTQTISGIGPFVLAPPSGFSPLTARGSWSINQNTGPGPYGLRRNSATDGESNNIFLITVSADVETISPLASDERNLSIAAYVNSLATGLPGSGGALDFRPGTGVVSARMSRQFLYQASTAAAFTLYFGFLYPNHATQGTFDIKVKDITITIQQQ